jgi:hypothetical protein
VKEVVTEDLGRPYRCLSRLSDVTREGQESPFSGGSPSFGLPSSSVGALGLGAEVGPGGGSGHYYGEMRVWTTVRGQIEL